VRQILAADIGGTNGRFAHFQADPADNLVLVGTQWLHTHQARSFAHLLEQLRETSFSLSPADADAAVFAVAGPVENGWFCKPPNISWDIDLTRDTDRVGLKQGLLINDFVAQAYACRSPIIREAHQIISGDVIEEATLAVIGAGTGLGHAALVPDGRGGYSAVPSEGGHISFPFQHPQELDLMRFLLDVTGKAYITTETVVSGGGLSLVHRFLTGETREPAEAAAEMIPDSETLRWMARFFARVCRNYALQVLARGGLYIAGGVAAKVPDLVTHPEFQSEFRNTVTMAHILGKMPVFLNSNEESGLWGSAMVGLQMLIRRYKR
jgi:glucokinase